ncbi:hypothetical protein BT63DRAFT_426905 [Microthyrium microscopicum]|uniref:Uncharacterized protein n=1 Tax=Microthyrium microscopicum TaxID=703497 RepID=A0A6A6U8Y2_9PEZI|nr:hypothetical protein BT63DRAFT_426905 [Microthyrium microscopicum]
MTSLSARCLKRFEELAAAERLFYNPTEPEYVTHDGYTFQFRLIKAFEQKPMPGNDTSDSHAAKPDPFGKPEKDFIIEDDVNNTHILQLNKFCALRPQMLLHPRKYAPQAEPLELSDFMAAWDVLPRLERNAPHVAFYNCGVESGSSQPYRHIQIIEKPLESEFLLFPDNEDMKERLQATLEFIKPPSSLNVPFYCLVLGIAGRPAKEIHSIYQKMIQKVGETIGQVTAHNVIFTSDWLCFVPRRKALTEDTPANAMGMMGMVWVSSEEERASWDELGMTGHLKELAFPA